MIGRHGSQLARDRHSSLTLGLVALVPIGPSTEIGLVGRRIYGAGRTETALLLWRELDSDLLSDIARDFPLLARAYLDGRLMLDELITGRIRLDDINAGFAALKRGEAIRSVVMFD